MFDHVRLKPASGPKAFSTLDTIKVPCGYFPPSLSWFMFTSLLSYPTFRPKCWCSLVVLSFWLPSWNTSARQMGKLRLMMHPNGKKHLPMAATCGNNEGFCSINGLEIQILYQIWGLLSFPKASSLRSVISNRTWLMFACERCGTVDGPDIFVYQQVMKQWIF